MVMHRSLLIGGVLALAGCSGELKGLSGKLASHGGDAQALTVESVKINGGNLLTKSTLVSLSFSGAPGATHLRVANDLDAFSDWLRYPAQTHTLGHTLAAQDGVRNVRVQFKYGDAATAPVSLVRTDDITLDRTPPTGGSLVINGGDAFATSGALQLAIVSAADAGTGVKHYQLSQADGTFSTDPTSWKVCAAGNFALGHEVDGDGERTVGIRFRDAAGNVSEPPLYDSIVVDTLDPSGSVRIGDGSDELDFAVVTLTLAASDSSGVKEYQVANEQQGWPESWRAWKPSSTDRMFVPHSLSPGDGAKTIYVKFRDHANRETIVSAAVSLQRVPRTLALTRQDQAADVRSEVLSFFAERQRDFDFAAPLKWALQSAADKQSILNLPGDTVRWLFCEDGSKEAVYDGALDCSYAKAALDARQVETEIIGFNAECYDEKPAANPVECQDYVGALRRMFTLAHNNGKLLIVTPAATKVQELAADIAPYADIVVLQIPDTVDDYVGRVTRTAATLKEKNPGIIVLVQLISKAAPCVVGEDLPCNGAASQITDNWQDVKAHVDGFQIFFYKNFSPLTLLKNFYDAAGR